MIGTIRNNFIKAKMYIGRSATYISLVNMGMILFLTLSNLKEKGYVHFEISKYIILIYLLTFIILIFFGWLEMKYIKGFQKEVDFMNNYTPLHPKLEELYQYMKSQQREQKNLYNQNSSLKS